MTPSKQKNTIISLGIVLAALVLTYIPLPTTQKKITIVSGSELKETLEIIEDKFEEVNPNIDINIEIQGSQDIINNYVDDNNDFKPTVLIPANGVILKELETRWKATENSEPFYQQPTPIAKTILVAIAWEERAAVLFPDNNFDWNKIEQAMKQRSWDNIGGKNNWGSFDFVTTNPTRSNSGQLTLSLWAQDELGVNNLSISNINSPKIRSLFSLIKNSVYQPPRSTDILLQEFIARGPNDADIATVYESIALYRWSQAQVNQNKAYRIYYLNPTIETVATAAIVRRDVDNTEVKAAKKFIDFLIEKEQQEIFIRHGFRPVNNSIKLESVANSPWNQNIPGAQTDLSIKTTQPPSVEIIGEIQRLWQ